MSKDIDKIIKEAEETIGSLEKMANQKMNDAEQKIKKSIVQTALWILATVAIYFIWGTTWFFWVAFTFNVMSVAGIVFAKVMMAKAYKKMAEKDDDYDIYNYSLGLGDDTDDENEEIEYDEKQKTLELLLNTLEEIAQEHDELYDTDCREQMSEAIFNGFIFEKESYVMPNSFGLSKEEGNSAVKKALTTYIETMLPLAKEATPEERLEMFQDDDVYSQSGEAPDDFFGWFDVEDLDLYK